MLKDTEQTRIIQRTDGFINGRSKMETSTQHNPFDDVKLG